MSLRRKFSALPFKRWTLKLSMVSLTGFVFFTAGFHSIALPPADAETGMRYTVKQGDCLWLIARRHGVTVDALVSANGLRSDLITPGQVLNIPGKNTVYAALPVSRSVSIKHKVAQGDCLWHIARRYGVTVVAIKQANGLSSDLLQPGQVLNIPGGAGTATPATNPRFTSAVSSPVPSRSGDVVQELLSYARSLLGTRYRWAGESPATGFDCSGFTKHVFGRFGIQLPHSAVAQNSCGIAVKRGEIAPGDILLFQTCGSGIDHAVIYCGDDRFIHASSRGGCVRMDSLKEHYWDTHFVSARRLLKTK
ncbi:MAG: LysM peptidoglycan-binding domain-containing protein [Bacillota bacterium]